MLRPDASCVRDFREVQSMSQYRPFVWKTSLPHTHTNGLFITLKVTCAYCENQTIQKDSKKKCRLCCFSSSSCPGITGPWAPVSLSFPHTHKNTHTHHPPSHKCTHKHTYHISHLPQTMVQRPRALHYPEVGSRGCHAVFDD